MTLHTPSRRHFLTQLSTGLGGLGLATFLADQGVLAARGDALRQGPQPHHAPKAKTLIYFNMQGGPTQFETFCNKPELLRRNGQELRDATRPGAKLLRPLFDFNRCGQSGIETSSILPHLSTVADELCVIHSMTCDDNGHPGGQREALTGYNRKIMPSLGSWILHGLGTENRNLPGYVYLADGGNHGSAFLPAQNQAMPVGARVPNLRRSNQQTDSQQREQVEFLGRLNQRYAEVNSGASELRARVEAAELAFRMQMSCPEAVDISQESQATLDSYGIADAGRANGPASIGGVSRASFATMCLVARRLVERGVRVITICVGGRRGWDHHSNLRNGVVQNAAVIDQPIAGLLKDLRQRGLLDSTLVMWGGEFGRTPYAQGEDGRDHFNKAYTMWLAGGGAKRGFLYGQTDEIGLNIIENQVHIRDLFATVLWLMGLDHQRLTYRYAGRDQRITDVNDRVVDGIMT